MSCVLDLIVEVNCLLWFFFYRSCSSASTTLVFFPLFSVLSSSSPRVDIFFAVAILMAIFVLLSERRDTLLHRAQQRVREWEWRRWKKNTTKRKKKKIVAKVYSQSQWALPLTTSSSPKKITFMFFKKRWRNLKLSIFFSSLVFNSCRCFNVENELFFFFKMNEIENNCNFSSSRIASLVEWWNQIYLITTNYDPFIVIEKTEFSLAKNTKIWKKEKV